MKRLPLAAVLSVWMHALLFSTNFTWMEKLVLGASPWEPIALSLEARIPTKTAARPNASSEIAPKVADPAVSDSSPSDQQKRDSSTDEMRSAEAGKTSNAVHEDPLALNKKRRYAQATRPPTKKLPGREESAAQPDKVAANASRKTTSGAVEQSKKRPGVAPPAAEKRGVGSVDTREPTTQLAAVAGTKSVRSVPPVAAVREAIPLYKQSLPPRYPRVARLRGYEGTVILDVLVSSNGEVSNCRIHESSGHGVLDKAAFMAVQRWVFEPGRQGNTKVEMWVKVPIRFQLN